jgi:hydrogenase large subunit
MPGDCSADITHQTCTDYYVQLMRAHRLRQRTVPICDDLYDLPGSLPGYDMVGYRDTNLVNWGCFDDPTRRLRLPQHDRVGSQALHHPRRRDQRRADLDRPGEINLMIRILLGSSTSTHGRTSRRWSPTTRSS